MIRESKPVRWLSLFFLKNAVLMTVVLTNAFGIGLVMVLGYFLVDKYFIGNFFPLLKEAGSILDPVGQFTFIAIIIVYELPIRRYLSLAHKKLPISDRLREKAGRRLLNEPFVMVLFTLGGWLFSTFIYTLIILNEQASWVRIRPLAVKSILIAIATASLVFFSVQNISYRFLTPRLFPQGGLHHLKGVWRISLRTRFFSLYAAVNLVPMLILLLVIYHFSITPQDPAELLEAIASGTMFFVPLVILLGFILTHLLSGNLTRSLDRLTRVLTLVKKGRFDERVQVISNDEIGYAGEVVNEMNQGLLERDLIKDVFGRYVAREVRDEVLSGRIPLDGEKKDVSVLFADLRDFTLLTETHDPKTVVEIMNEYFKEMAEAIQDYGGLILQFLGDEIYAVFGAPVARPDHAARAFRAGLEMGRRLTILNRGFAERSRPALAHGIGINTGGVVAANIGSPDRLSYLLVGDTVNVAARLQALNKNFNSEMIISAATKSGLTEEDLALASLKEVSQVRVKGKARALDIFTVTG